MAEAPGAMLSRRNLPRASHACQRCRLKKAKCDQRQPCANCIKYAQECTYGLRRRSTRERSSIHHTTSAQAGLSSPLPSPWSGQGEPNRRDVLEKTPLSDRLSVDNADVVGDVNQHTHGTEFYGTSSNFVLLNQFFKYARQHQPPLRPDSEDRDGSTHLSPANGDVATGNVSAQALSARPPLSIVNLLADEDVLDPPSRPKTPPQTLGEGQGASGVCSIDSNRPRINRLQGPSQSGVGSASAVNRSTTSNGQNSSSFSQIDPKATTPPRTSLQATQQRLEREYVRQFMDNLHHLHPMLDPVGFTARCEERIWNVRASSEKNKSQRHFFALYNVVVAVGALVSGSSLAQRFEQDIHMCIRHSPQGQNPNVSPSSRELSKTYFRKSRALLRNVFEVCSLESAQTLLLMSLYCQNSLKPHACYMYCGHAVRTALAIGIERESSVNSIEDRKAARRTWWCIYSHEIDMSCSAGRRDSLGKPHNYKIDLPHVRDRTSSAEDRSHLENQSVAMINEMVHFAAVLRRISKELYHDTKSLTLVQKSAVAKRLDALLDEWKDRLPTYLDFDHTSFRDEEWASKQKLVLHLRYLNARIVLHRPFLEAHVRKPEEQVSSHVEKLLEAARDTIRVMYSAYSSRHYFRTWWYNSTYTLYAGMIVLYIIMLDSTVIPLQELLEDVTKAQEILESMEEAVVARRSANLIREGLEVARAYVQGRQSRSIHPQANEGGSNPFVLNDITGQLSYAGIGQDPALFASIVDPNLLQDFTAADGDLLGLDFSMPSFDEFGGDEMHTDPDLSFL